MKNVFLKIGIAAAKLRVSMETDTISKKAASSKSNMSMENQFYRREIK